MRTVTQESRGGLHNNRKGPQTPESGDHNEAGQGPDMLETHSDPDQERHDARNRQYRALEAILKAPPNRGLRIHPLRREIASAIIMGQSIREVAVRFGVSKHQVESFRNWVLMRDTPDIKGALEALAVMGMEPKDIADNLPVARMQPGIDVGAQLKTMVDYLWDYIEKTKGSEKMLPAIREASKLYTDMMKIMEKRMKSGEFNPWEHPEVMAYQDGLIEILRLHPNALEDVLEYTRRYSGRAEESRTS